MKCRLPRHRALQATFPAAEEPQPPHLPDLKTLSSHPPKGGGMKARNGEPRHACGFLRLRRLRSGLSRDTFSPCEKRKRLRGVATARTRPRSPPPKACTLLGGWETHRSLGHAVAGMARRPLAATITRTLTKSSCLICVRSVIPRHVPSTQAFRFRHMVKRDLQ